MSMLVRVCQENVLNLIKIAKEYQIISSPTMIPNFTNSVPKKHAYKDR